MVKETVFHRNYGKVTVKAAIVQDMSNSPGYP